MTTQALPTLFVPHGAGPCFFMDWEPADTWHRMERWLRSVPELIGAQPRAIVMVSGHWEAPVFTINSPHTPSLLYDYHGFPPHTYELTYPAAGDPAVAERVQQLLQDAGFDVATEKSRGLDHGVFIPLKLMFPHAEIPVVQLSLKQGLDPAEHLAMGRALAPLRSEGALIIGSGMSYHNMQRFRSSNATIDPDSVRFDAWLADTVAQPPTQREQRLQDWANAPSGRAAHPREEHLLPLHVVAGAAGANEGRQVFQDRVLGSVQSAFMFGG